jgi:hypothetical protein
MRSGACAECKIAVAERAGTLLGPPWRVVCQSCLPFPTTSPVVIRVFLVGDKVEVAPSDKLGSDRWGAYKAVLDRQGVRARKVGAGWQNTAPLSSAPALCKALSDQGFILAVAAEVTQAIEAAAQVARAQVDAAAARAAQVDQQMAKLGKSLYPFQLQGVGWLATRNAAILADEPGLGKTVQALASIPTGAPVLVICPAVAKGVWKRETSAWRSDLTAIKIDGRGRFRWPVAGEVLVVNDEILPTCEIETGEVNDEGEPKMAPAPFLADCPAGLVVIHDECHRGKNSRAKRTQKVRAIGKAARAVGGRTLGLSGTPLMNRAPDLWSVLSNMGLQDTFGGWFGFARSMGGRQQEIRVARGKTTKIWVWDGQPTAAAADALRRVMLRRVKDDVLPDLPAKTYKTVDVEITDADLLQQLELLQETMEEFGLGTYFEDGEAQRLARKDAGISFHEISATRARLAAAKLDSALQVVEEFEDAAEPLIVFSAHRAPVEAIGAREGWATIVGGIPAAERTQIEEDFQAGKLKGVAITIGAGAVAITLTRASNAMFIDRSWTPAENQQAEDRIRRIGTTKPVQIIDLVAEHPLDQAVTAALIRKQSVVDASIEAARVKAGETVLNAAQVAESAADALATMGDRRAQAETHGAQHAAALEALLAKFAAEDEAAERERAADDAAKKDPRLALERRIERAWTKFKGQDSGAPRGPQTHKERWADQALQLLASMDMDYAYEQNGVGFNKADCGIGHALARAASVERLTDGGWRLAIQVATHYPRQVGRPTGDEASL